MNRRPVMAATFEFTARDGRRHEVETRSVDTTRREDEAQESLPYDANDPSKAQVLDGAPAKPRMGLNGDLAGRPMRAFGSILLPILVIAGNALAACFKFT